MAPNADTRPLAARLWIYQAERFPLLRHAILIGAFSTSAVCLSALLRGRHEFPRPAPLAVAFAVSLGSFLLLRIADEFKDAEADARYRPERPVPRGLVALRELARVAAAVIAAQALLVVLFLPGLLVPLAGVWCYLLLMTREFFAPGWLRRRPLVYMASHMLILPLVNLFATACDWWESGLPPPGLSWFLALGFANGVVLELGRKTWAPQDERAGVESYSSAWGLARALSAWAAAAACAFALAAGLAARIDFVLPTAGILALLGIGILRTAITMAQAPTPGLARRVETLSGLWVLAGYLLLGPVAMVLR
jgi:hypothetical protein